MRNTDIFLNDVQMFGDTKVILCDQSEDFYENGKRVDTPQGVIFTVSAPAHNFAIFRIKVKTKLLPYSEEQVNDRCSNLNPIFVKFINFKAKPYSTKDSRAVLYSCEAEGIEVLDEKDVDIFGG